MRATSANTTSTNPICDTACTPDPEGLPVHQLRADCEVPRGSAGRTFAMIGPRWIAPLMLKLAHSVLSCRKNPCMLWDNVKGDRY